MEVETKECEFTYASFGSIGLESAFGVANTALKEAMDIETIIEKFYAGPRRILGMEIPSIEKNAKADLTIFDPDMNWTYAGTKHSLSSNDALSGMTFTGRVLATIAKNQFLLNA